MKLALLALVLTAIAPSRITLGPVSLPAAALLAAGEALLTIGGAWLAVRIIRRARPLWCPAWSRGGAW